MHKNAHKLRSQPTRVKPHRESFLHDTEVLHRFQRNEDGQFPLAIFGYPQSKANLEPGVWWSMARASSFFEANLCEVIFFSSLLKYSNNRSKKMFSNMFWVWTCLKVFFPFLSIFLLCPFSLYQQHLEPGSCYFHDVSNILTSNLSLSIAFASFEWNLQHFGAGNCHFKDFSFYTICSTVFIDSFHGVH